MSVASVGAFNLTVVATDHDCLQTKGATVPFTVSSLPAQRIRIVRLFVEMFYRACEQKVRIGGP